MDFMPEFGREGEGMGRWRCLHRLRREKLCLEMSLGPLYDLPVLRTYLLCVQVRVFPFVVVVSVPRTPLPPSLPSPPFVLVCPGPPFVVVCPGPPPPL